MRKRLTWVSEEEPFNQRKWLMQGLHCRRGFEELSKKSKRPVRRDQRERGTVE